MRLTSSAAEKKISLRIDFCIIYIGKSPAIFFVIIDIDFFHYHWYFKIENQNKVKIGKLITGIQYRFRVILVDHNFFVSNSAISDWIEIPITHYNVKQPGIKFIKVLFSWTCQQFEYLLSNSFFGKFFIIVKFLHND